MSVQPVSSALLASAADGNGAGFDGAIAAARQRSAGTEAAGQQNQIGNDELTQMIGQFGSKVGSMLLMPRMTDMLGEVMADEDA